LRWGVLRGYFDLIKMEDRVEGVSVGGGEDKE